MGLNFKPLPNLIDNMSMWGAHSRGFSYVIRHGWNDDHTKMLYASSFKLPSANAHDPVEFLADAETYSEAVQHCIDHYRENR